jgi:hypothetical protein
MEITYSKTVTVDREKEGCFKSIQEALDSSGPDTNILVAHGYYEPFVINFGNICIQPESS